ncbi:MAG: hypothetical protein LCH44_13895 [Bacteroidetes bacterium]|nr:hypothetical protein [Bacteroidota bacterium]
MKPPLFPWILSLDEETELYTQRRAESEPPANYKFRLITLFNWIKTKLGIQNVVIEFPNPVTVWPCPHNMGRRTNLKCVDLDGNILNGEWEYIDDNNEVIRFNTPRAGKAIFS